MMSLFRQRILWLGFLAALLTMSVFGVAMMGSVAGAKPKSLPVALVALDRPAELPNGETLAVGEMMKEMLLSNAQLPLRWEIVNTEADARQGLADQRYYGALVIPENLSSGILSLQSPSPEPAVVQVLVNEGMNSQAAAAVKQILNQTMNMAGAQLSVQSLDMIGQRADMISLSTAKAMLHPLEVREETVFPVGANHAGGNAPGMLTQILWIGSMIASVILFHSMRKSIAPGSRRGISVVWQSTMGILLAGLLSGYLVWMASSWYGMEMTDAAGAWLVLWLAGAAFFLLQSALLNWIGLPALGLLVLLMFFSMPVLNMAPEFLPQATQDWLYSWTPLRFAASALRDVLYFDGVSSSVHATVLWFIAGGFLALMLASMLKRERDSEQQGAGTVSVSS